MSQTLMVRFGADTSAAKTAVLDLASSVAQSVVTLGTAVRGQVGSIETLGATMQKLSPQGLVAALRDPLPHIEALSAALSKAAESKGGGGLMEQAQHVRDLAAALRGLPAGTMAGVLRGEAEHVQTLNAALKDLAGNPVAEALHGHIDKVGALREGIGKIPEVIGFAVRAFVGLQLAKLALDGITHAASMATAELDNMAKVGQDAARLGVSTSFLQTYRGQARALKVDVEDLTKALEAAHGAFTINQGEGGKDARNDSAFGDRLRKQQEAGNVTDEQVGRFDAAVGTEAKLRTALNIMAELQARGSELAALDLAKLVFPEEIVERIRAGTIEVGRLSKSLENLKNPDLVLLKPEEIARAQDLQRRLKEAEADLERANQIFRNEWAQAGISLREDAVRWTEIMAGGARAAVSILRETRRMGEEWQRGGAGLGGRSGQQSLGGELGGAATRGRQPAQTEDDRQRADALAQLRQGLGSPTAIAGAQAQSREMIAALRPDTTKPITAKEEKAKHASTATEELNAVETLINGIERQSAALKAELESYYKSNVEKRVAIELAKAEEVAKQHGITVTEEQTKRIREAAEATATLKDKLADLEQAQRQGAETFRYFGSAAADSLGDIIFDAQKATDVLSHLSKQLGRQSLNAFLTGTGPLASFFGTAPEASKGSDAVGGLFGTVRSATKDINLGDTLKGFFGGFRANGGPVAAGRAYRINERGEEWFIPAVDGRVAPASAGRGGATAEVVGRGDGKPLVVHFNVQSPDAQGFVRSEAQVTGMLARAVQRGLRGA